MRLKEYLKERFGKDIFSHLSHNEILEERIKAEKHIEKISDDLSGIQDKIQDLMLKSKGQPIPMKMLNIQKIKTLRLEAATKQQEASGYIKQLQLLLLVESMREHHKSKEKNEFIEKILDADVDHLNDMLFKEDVKKSVEEGRMDDVKDKLKRVFAKVDSSTDAETRELMGAIDDLESVDEETALQMAAQKAKDVSEHPLKKAVLEDEE